MTGLTVLLIYITGAVAPAYVRPGIRTVVSALSALLLIYLLSGTYSWFWFLFLASSLAVEGVGIVTVAEAQQLRQYDKQMLEVIQVDEFPYNHLARTRPVTVNTADQSSGL